jgi:hypothetical protein
MSLHRNILSISFCFGLLSGFQLLPNTPVIKNYNDDARAQQSRPQPKDMLDDEFVSKATEDSSETIVPRPSSLPFLSLPHTDIVTVLDDLMTKQTGHRSPYIPFIQNVSMGIEQVSLVKNIWYLFKKLNKRLEHPCYEFSSDVSILFRGNIRLGGKIGYRSWYSDKMHLNQCSYISKGWYTGIGIGYLSHFNATNDIFLGINYNMALFQNSAIDEKSKTISQPKALKASWFDIFFGAESRFLDKVPLYGGCTLHLGSLYHYTPFKQAENYSIPGYGLNVNKFFNLRLDLHILYKFIFVENLIAFD